MCGIAGIVLRDRAVAPEQLAAMASRIEHRGPEDTGFYCAGAFGIAHTRLAIIDLAGGHQPIFDAQKRYAIVCNGEIYNFPELRRELEALGRAFSCDSDSEVALQAFAAWGADAFKRLHGMFAFALYDHVTQELWLVRDRLGIKPLYYAVLPDRVVFGSELKALLPQLPSVELHEPALAQYFQNQYSTGEATVIRGVRRVPPGHALRIDARLAIESRRWWNALAVPAPRMIDERQAREEWEPLIEQVMREHVRSDVPYGLFLSGGVDSAVLLGLLKRYQSTPVRSFSIGYSDAQLRDELDDAQRIARHFGAEHTPIRLSRQQVFHRLPRAAWAADDLMRDYACLPTLALAEAASRELKVVFSGEGGDEAFAGYGRYRPDWSERTYKRMRFPGSGGFRVRAELDAGWTRRLFIDALQPHLTAYRQPVIDAWSATPDAWTDLQRRQYVDLVGNLPDDLLVKGDRMLMSFSVEGRVPFVDHRVIEFGLSLPDSLKVSRQGGKTFIKRWAESFIPRDYLWQPKRGFHVPIKEWLNGAFMDALRDKLPRSEAVRRWCHEPAVRELLTGDASSRSREIWSLMQFAIWHRLFIERPDTKPAAEEDPLAWL
jgi:asparagine synthase (glutamine-hydrolysing)